MRTLLVGLLIVAFSSIPVFATEYRVPKTGQTTIYNATDDGDLQMGAAWPSPRFTVVMGGSGMLDNLTNLIWQKNAMDAGNGSCFNSWDSIFTYATDYNDSMVGNNYGYTDWRVPNINELESLVNYSYASMGEWLLGQGLQYPYCDGDMMTNPGMYECIWSSSFAKTDSANGPINLSVKDGADITGVPRFYSYPDGCGLWLVRPNQ